MNLLMLGSDTSIVRGQQGPLANTLSAFASHWDRIDILTFLVPGVEKFTCFDNVTFWPSPWQKILQPFFVFQQGQKLARERRYDLIVSHDYGFFLNGWGALFLSAKLNVPYLSEIHHVEGYPRATTVREWLYAWAARIYVSTIQKRILGFRVVNEYELKPLLQQWGVPAEKIHLLYSLYLDFNIFNPVSTSKDYDAIFVGRMSYNKAPFLFLDSLLVANKQRPVRAVMLGRGDLLQKVKDYAKQIRLNIDFIDWVESPTDLANLYRRSKCLICTSYSEGGPRVVAEALACGTPVISTRIGMAHELIRDNDNGFLCDWDVNEIGHRLLQIISDDSLQTRLSANAPVSVQQFEKTKVIREYAEGYQQLVAK